MEIKKPVVNKPVVKPIVKKPVVATSKPVVKKPLPPKKPIQSSLSKEKQLQQQADLRKRQALAKKVDMDFYNKYTKTVQNGTANYGQYGRYQGIVNKYKLKAGNIGNSQLQNMSIAALNGDKKAQEYMKNMHHNPLKGASLWKGYDTSKLKGKTGAHYQYVKDNPYEKYTKNHEMKYYNRDSQWLMDNSNGLSANDREWYSKVAKKWGMADMTDPLQQTQGLLQRDKENALNAQDVALNTGMANMDRNSFQQMQGMKQDMSNRGIQDSGLAQDSYMRATMANNANYQTAYSEAATNKANIASQYDTQIGAAKEAVVERKDKLAAAADKLKLDNQAAQLKKDQFLTSQSGLVYMNGKPLTYKGKSVTTMEFKKLSETQRHNMATENNVSEKNLFDYRAKIDSNNASRADSQLDYNSAIDRNNVDRQGNQLDYNAKIDANNAQREGNQLDYSLGMDKNAVARQKISADLEKAAANMQYNYAKLDLSSTKLQSDIDLAEAKLKIMAKDSSTKELAARATSIGKQLASVQSQINAYVKKGKKPPAVLGDKLQSLQEQMSQLAGMGK